MDKAKAAISGIMSKAGHHDTTVHESTAPKVTQEHVKPTQHENVTTAVDKEVHQDHYHTTVQPVQDREVLPEKHSHQQTATEERRFDHGNADQDKRQFAAEAGQYQDTQTVGQTTHSQSMNPAVQSERVHHHVHEQIQPVVQKETIQPHVVHTTAPVHEVHQNSAQHHGSTTLPPVSMGEFQNKGGAIDQHQERKYGFDGAPEHQPRAGVASGTTGNTGMSGTSGSTGTTDSSTGKPSMMDKLNPKVDASGDGKAGFMK